MAFDLSEAGSLDLPLPPRGTAAGGQVGVGVCRPQGPPPGLPVMGPLTGPGGEVADLVRCLAGAQANDIGWPVFNGRYVEYPRFRKEWWAYRRSYHGHVKDELACRALKEKSLASSVKILVNDIENLREAWDTLVRCFDRSEKNVLEAII